MRKLNKKAIWFGALSSIVIFIFVFGLIVAMRTKLDKFERILGEDQIRLSNFYQDAQKAPFFIAKAAIQAGHQSIYELGLRGGFFEQYFGTGTTLSSGGSKITGYAVYPLEQPKYLQQEEDTPGTEPKPLCDNYEGYALWQTKDRGCYPDAKESFKLFFQKYLDEYLKEYPDAGIPLNNYEFSITGSEKLKIEGHAIKNIIFPSKPSKHLRWKEDTMKKFSQEERECLGNESSVPWFEGGSYKECRKCPSGAECSWYINEDYCNVDPCNLGCVGGYFFGYSGCMECPDDATCGKYVDEEYCNRDPCNLGCVWDRKEEECEKFETDMWYALKPSFNAEIDYDINVYEFLKLEVKRMIGNIVKCEPIKGLNVCFNEGKARANDRLKQRNLQFVDLKECEAEDVSSTSGDRTYKFCVKSDKKFLVYNETSSEIEYENVLIKFALYMIDFPPEPVEKVEIFDNKAAKQSVIVKWSDTEDAESYNIYWSANPFLDKKIENHAIPDTNKIEISNLGDAERIEDIDLTVCKPSKIIPLETPCVYGVYENVLLRNKLYFIESEDSYLYVVDGLVGGRIYYFAVTGVDVSGNELDNDKSKPDNRFILTYEMNYLRGKSDDT